MLLCWLLLIHTVIDVVVIIYIFLVVDAWKPTYESIQVSYILSSLVPGWKKWLKHNEVSKYIVIHNDFDI